ncbi:MAG TPA: hypothetical protein VK821_18640 [Dehalococcoidia bacterium]|nr:hypothetical protein [Dehalococcoidia bacterium]
MRLLVVGMPLPNQRIDNYSFFSAPSFFDYDAVLIDPAAMVQATKEVLSGAVAHATAADEPVVNAPTEGLNVGLGDLLRRRRDETERLLARGGTVAVFARPNQTFRFVAGFPAADQYCWLPVPPEMAFAEPYLVPSFGTQVVVTDSASPLAPFVNGFQSWFHYRAYFAEHLASFAGKGHIFARSVGGAAVGVRFGYGRGQLFFLPAMYSTPEGEPRFSLAQTLLGCLTQAVHAASEEQAPEWIGSVRLPGIEPLELAVDQARTRLDEATERYDEAETKLDQVARFRRLIWQEGRYGLEPIVREAFRTLGFKVNLDVDVPAVLDADGRTAFLEAEGSDEPVVEWPYFRLQKRLEKDLIETREVKKGVIVVNGLRRSPLADRAGSYSDALRIACENYRYALLSSENLLSLVREAERNPDEDSLRRLRGLVFDMVGDQVAEGFPRELAPTEMAEMPPAPAPDAVP